MAGFRGPLIRAAGGIAAGITLAVLIITLGPGARGDAQGQSSLELLIDVRTSGNEPASIGNVDSCVSIDEGDEIDVDLLISNAPDMTAWEATLTHDRSVLEITSQEARLFIAQDPGSNLVQASEQLPDNNGRHLLSVGDVSAATESGDGVLARITFKAIGEGITEISVPQTDLHDDGVIDEGARLSGVRGVLLGDVNGDGFFDGPVQPGYVAVGRECSAVVTPHATPHPTADANGQTTEASPSAAGETPSASEGGGPVASASPGEPGGSPAAGSSSPGRGTSTPRAGEATDGAGASGTSAGDGGGGFPWWAIALAVAAALCGAGGLVIVAYRRVSNVKPS